MFEIFLEFIFEKLFYYFQKNETGDEVRFSTKLNWLNLGLWITLNGRMVFILVA